ncbi:MAG: linear amide C-N hydrolase [Verrucomicrobiota bacterium]
MNSTLPPAPRQMNAGLKTILCAALAPWLLTGPAGACSFVDVQATDGTVAIGRSIEWSFPMGYTFMIIPRGRAFTGSYPADKVAPGFKGTTWTSKYAYAGVGVAVQAGLDSGQNEAGLNMEGLNLPGFTEFQTVTPESKAVIALSDLGDWLLGNFATVSEVRDALPKCTVWTPAVSSEGSASIHIVVTDRTGAGLVIEYVKGKLNLHDNVTHSFANSPPYDWHLANLRNYMTLTSKDTAHVSMNGYTLDQLSTGDGLTGLPGDFKSASRFVKLSLLRSFAAPVANSAEACSLAGHIINTVDIPMGAVNSGDYQGKPLLETAQIVFVKDLTHNKLFVADYAHRLNYVFIDLNALFALNKPVGPVLFSKVLDQPPINVTEQILQAK